MTATAAITGCCCWTRRRRRRGRRRRRRSTPTPSTSKGLAIGEEGEDGEEEEPLLGQQQQQSFHFYGIPLQSPADYYDFLMRPSTSCARAGTESGVGGDGEWDWRRRYEHLRNSTITAKSKTSAAQPLISSTDSSSSTTQQQPSALYGLVKVKLERSADGAAQQHLGLGIAGGTDKAFPPTISYLRPGYIAHRCDQLQVGDRLVAVNGRHLSALRHEEVMQLVRSSGPSIHLEVEYDLNGPYFQRPPLGSDGLIKKRTTEIILEKDFDSLLGNNDAAGRALPSGGGGSLFGMIIRGGAYGPDARKSRPITVTAIRPGGPAHREGRLRVGDRILSVNGMDVAQSTLSMANNLLRQTLGPRAHLTVEYDCSVLETLRRARGPLLLEIEKVPGVDFGVVLTMRWMRLVLQRKERWVVVERVIQASIADRCGAIHPGDVLKAVDGISLEFTGNLAEVYQLLRSECPLLRLELLPAALADQMRFHTAAAVDNLQQQPTQHQSIKVANEGSISARLERPRHHSSAPTTGQICHSETMEVILQRPPEPQPTLRIGPPTIQGSSLGSVSSSNAPSSFGISLERLPDASDDVRMLGGDEAGYLAGITNTGGGIYISAIERGSPAERCGLLQVGDRVVSINDWFTANGTLEEARHVLRHAGSSATLLVEIDVIEPILPPTTNSHTHGGHQHSTVTVKLVKPRLNNSIGIVCRSECGGKKGEPLVIADIRTGSVAHRCGALQVGDRIAAIDGIPLDTCSVEESMRLLQRSSGTVKLSIIKNGGDDLDLTTPGGSTPDGSPSAPTITYTIEMDRKLQQPLGLTISSVGQGTNDPVVISQLTPGGLADLTGALHIGDQLIAINGESLMGEHQKVARAIQMLQQPNGGRVQLKVRRLLTPSTATIGLVAAGRWPPMHRIGMMEPGGGRIASQLSTIQSAGSVPGSEDGDGSEEEKTGSPLKSVDSAVDSLEDSPDAALARQLAAAAAKTQAGGTPHRPPTTAFNRPSSSSHPSNAPDVISGGSAGSSEPGVGPSSSAGGGGWDSGMSSGAETITGGGISNNQMGMSRANCCLCQAAKRSGHTHSDTTREKEDWMRILEALETVGEEEMLRKLEESIIEMGSGSSPHSSGGAYPIMTSEQRTPTLGAVRRPFSPTIINTPLPAAVTGHYANTALIDHSNYSTIVKKAPPPPIRSNGVVVSGAGKPLSTFVHTSNGPTSFNSTLPPPMPSIATSPSHHDGYASIPYFSSPTSPAPTITPRPVSHHQMFTVRLRKDAATKNYGFSVSDGSTTFTSPTVAGIYVNSVLEGSVAESVGIRHMDRVLQVNGTSMDCLNCDLALPLLAAEELELVLMRGGEPSDGGDHAPIGDGTLMGERKMSSIVQSSV